jgi:hypothetical protein
VKKLKRYQVILIAIFFIVMMGIVGQMDVEEEQRQDQEYCDMIKLWEETKGQAGWPAFKSKEGC